MDESRIRDEHNRRRHRALAVQIKRALITLANGISQWLADDPDEEITLMPGDSRTLPPPTNRPPAPYR